MAKYIDKDKLMKHYAWWGDDNEQKKVFDEIIEQITEDNGINYVIQLFSSIVKTVFMSVVEEAPHQKHSFIWETNKKN